MWKKSLWSSWPIQASKPNYERFYNFQNGGLVERVVWQVACLFRWLMMCKGTVISSIIIIILIWEGSPTNFVRYQWFSLIIIYYHWLSLIIIYYHWYSLIIIDYHCPLPSLLTDICLQKWLLKPISACHPLCVPGISIVLTEWLNV